MRRLVGSGLLALTLAACASTPARPADGVGSPSSPPAPTDPGVARTVLAVIGTPFFFLFKVAVCATTTVIAAPAVAILALVEEPYQHPKRDELSEGFAKNCGSPYILSP